MLLTVIMYIIGLKDKKTYIEKPDKLSRRDIEKIYKSPIDYCTIGIQYYELDRADDTALNKALEKSQNLVNLLVQQGNLVRNYEIFKAQVKKIEFGQGTLEIVIPKIHTLVYPNATTNSVWLYLRTSNRQLLEEIIAKNQIVYHSLEWRIQDSYSLELIINRIKKNTRKSYRRILRLINAEEEYLSVEYDIVKINKIKISTDIYQHTIVLKCSTKGAEQGFYKAHRLLTPEKIISILFGKNNNKSVEELFEGTLKLQTY